MSGTSWFHSVRLTCIPHGHGIARGIIGPRHSQLSRHIRDALDPLVCCIQFATLPRCASLSVNSPKLWNVHVHVPDHGSQRSSLRAGRASRKCRVIALLSTRFRLLDFFRTEPSFNTALASLPRVRVWMSLVVETNHFHRQLTIGRLVVLP